MAGHPFLSDATTVSRDACELLVNESATLVCCLSCKVWDQEVDVIHDLSRYRQANNCAIVCAADLITDSDKAAAHEFCIESLVLRDIRVEGKCMCPIRIAVQSQIRNIKIERLWIDEWDRSEDRCGLKDFKKNSHVTKYFSDLEEAFLEISDFRIGGDVVTEANAESLGRMTVDPLFHSKWCLRASHEHSRQEHRLHPRPANKCVMM